VASPLDPIVSETRRGLRLCRGGANTLIGAVLPGEADAGEPAEPPNPGTLRLPAGFLLGAATAGYQVEGGLDACDWQAFTTSAAIQDRVRRLSSLVGRAIVLQPPGDAVGHDDLAVLEADLDRARLLGLNAYRFSVEWSRVQPHPPRSTVPDDLDFDQAALDFYRAAIEAMRARGLEPVLTLNHLTLPRWVLEPPRESSVLKYLGLPTAVPDATYEDSLRGWESEQTVRAFVHFVEQVVTRYKDLVDWWITLNEPVGSMIGLGYVAGVWSPGFNLGGVFPAQAPFKRTRAESAYLNLLRAHTLAYDTLKELDDVDADGDGDPARVGFAHAMMHAVPAQGPDPLGANLAAARQFTYFFNDHMLDSLIGNRQDPAASVVDVAIEAQPQWRKEIPSNEFFGVDSTAGWRPRLDFIGVNYYRRVHAWWDPVVELTTSFVGGRFRNDLTGEREPPGLLNDLGWEIEPLGMTEILRDLDARYGLPLLITENGMADAFGGNRAAYTVGHLREVLRAIEDGVDVLGYLHWSLIDNFEWHEGYREEARFGLFRVERGADPANGGASQPRHITEAALMLQVVATQRGLEGCEERFGAISPSGRRTDPPTRLAAEVFEGQVDGAPASLYVARLDQPAAWLGMLFVEPARRWIRVEDMSWEESQRRLRFSHPDPESGGQVEYEATEAGGVLTGTVQGPAGEAAWTAARLPPSGLWTSPALVRALFLRRLEGEFGGWQGKLLEHGERPRWRELRGVSWDGQALSFGVPGFGSFEGTVQQDTMQGGLRYVRAGTTWTAPWQAQRAHTGLPF
jgi:beta-glucosidase/6-phospho-beta-glucosidase/beta-galactosidase